MRPLFYGKRMKESPKIELGRCTRVHGIKGEFTFSPHSGDQGLLEQGRKIWCSPLDAKSTLEKGGAEYEVSKVKAGNKLIVSLTGVADRTQAEQMIPFSYSVDRASFPKLEDEYYVADLLGLDVHHADTDQKLGTVVGHGDNGAQIILQIQLEQRSLELPFIDNFFPRVDLEAKKIWVVVPEYV